MFPLLEATKFTSKNVSASDPVRGQALVMARWIAIFGQAITVLVSYYGLGFIFPIVPCMGFIVLSGLINNYAYIKDHHRTMPPSRAFTYLAFDVFQLTGLLAFTGGIGNPFCVLLLAPVLVGAGLLPRRYMAILVAFGLCSALFITTFYYPLQWPSEIDGEKHIHDITQSLGLLITLVFAGLYAWRIAEENRAIQKASYAAKTALLKQKQLQALGAQAAAAVHELGSPLGTITIIAKELSHEFGENHPQSEDINLLIDQTKRCQTILKDFGATLRHDASFVATPLPVADLLRNITNEFLRERTDIRFRINQSPETPPIRFMQSAEIIYGLGVFIQNAIQFATSMVTISIRQNTQNRLEITIIDDGIGFAPHILSKLGEPYTSTRLDSGKNMGLGIFIAQTLLEETGAIISYNNRIQGGAQVKLEWTEGDLRTMFPDNTFKKLGQ